MKSRFFKSGIPPAQVLAYPSASFQHAQPHPSNGAFDPSVPEAAERSF
jgi:hypothetical protein